jgi:uncharacterized membrane protein
VAEEVRLGANNLSQVFARLLSLDRLEAKPGALQRLISAPLQGDAIMPAGASGQSDRELSPSLQQNISAIEERRRRESRSATGEERVAEAITAFVGSMRFVYLHFVIYGGWILVNLELVPILRPFDPSFVTLAMVASVEAIFLSTFVLISQNRSAAAEEKRADLDLQISMLAEQELTKLALLVANIAEHIGVAAHKHEVDEITREVRPDTILDEIEAQQRRSD